MTRTMTLRFLGCLAVLFSVSLAAPAQTAVVTVSHDDPDGLVEPGQIVRISVGLDWTVAAQFAGLAGSLGPAPAVGVAAAPTTPLGGVSALINPGFAVGGGIFGYDVASIPPYFTAGPSPVPGWSYPPIAILEYDWTAPAHAAGPISFDFVAKPLAPSVRLYPNMLTPNFIEAPTTYVGASLVVVPTPAATVPLAALCWLGVGGRRRVR